MRADRSLDLSGGRHRHDRQADSGASGSAKGQRTNPLSREGARCRVGYVFGLAGNRVLLGKVADLAEDAAVRRALGEGDKIRRYGEFRRTSVRRGGITKAGNAHARRVLIEGA